MYDSSHCLVHLVFFVWCNVPLDSSLDVRLLTLFLSAVHGDTNIIAALPPHQMLGQENLCCWLKKPEQQH